MTMTPLSFGGDVTVTEALVTQRRRQKEAAHPSLPGGRAGESAAVASIQAQGAGFTSLG